MHRPEDDAASTTVLLKTAKIEETMMHFLVPNYYTL